jgi:hypothetical protein
LFPYWLLFSVFAAGALQHRRRSSLHGQTAPLLGTAAAVVALMIGLRYEVGGDWETYLSIYHVISYSDFATAIASGDPGYAFLNWFAVSLGLEIWFVNLLCGVIFSWGLFRFARRQANPWLTFVIGIPYLVIVVAMGYSRQGVAIGIVLAGLSTLERSSVIRFGLYVFAAATFHKSAIIVLPLVALASSRNRLVTAATFLLLAVILYWFLIRDSMDRLVTNYVEAEYSSQGAAIRVAMNVPPALVFLAFQRRFRVPEAARRLWRNFSLAALGSVALLLFVASSTAIDRLALHLIPLQLFVLSHVPDAFPDRKGLSGQLILAVIAYCATIQFVWLNYAQHAEFWVPYRVYPFSGVS